MRHKRNGAEMSAACRAGRLRPRLAADLGEIGVYRSGVTRDEIIDAASIWRRRLILNDGARRNILQNSMACIGISVSVERSARSHGARE